MGVGMSLQMTLLVGLGGFLGTVARYLSSVLVNTYFPAPGLATLVVNILGSFIIGWAYGSGSEKFDVQTWNLMTIGVLGGFTTFSAFSAETLYFMKDGRWPLAVGYVMAMVILGLFATYLGFHYAK